jgi:hypothetical protein
MRVSLKHGAGFYRRALEDFLKGTHSPPRDPVEELVVSGLGEAISIAAAVGCHAEAQNWATITKVETDYPDVGKSSCAQIRISLSRHHELKKSLEDEHTKMKEEHKDLCRALHHQDSIERMKCVFAGSLKYGSKVQAEIFEELAFQDMRKQPLSEMQRLKGAVMKVKKVTGQRKLGGTGKDPSDEKKLLLGIMHWLEATDPSHRYGGNLKYWYNIWKDADTTDGFWEWLDNGPGKDMDTEECTRETLDKSQVKYLTIIERESYFVEPKDGLLRYTQSGDVVDGPKIFVMDPKGAFYMGDKKRGRFHHSSFLAGSPVLVAGSAVLAQGKFTELTPHSGHYRPRKEDFQDFAQKLKDEGVSEEIFEFVVKEVHDEHFGMKEPDPDKEAKKKKKAAEKAKKADS